MASAKRAKHKSGWPMMTQCVLVTLSVQASASYTSASSLLSSSCRMIVLALTSAVAPALGMHSNREYPDWRGRHNHYDEEGEETEERGRSSTGTSDSFSAYFEHVQRRAVPAVPRRDQHGYQGGEWFGGGSRAGDQSRIAAPGGTEHEGAAMRGRYHHATPTPASEQRANVRRHTGWSPGARTPSNGVPHGRVEGILGTYITQGPILFGPMNPIITPEFLRQEVWRQYHQTTLHVILFYTMTPFSNFYRHATV